MANSPAWTPSPDSGTSSSGPPSPAARGSATRSASVPVSPPGAAGANWTAACRTSPRRSVTGNLAGCPAPPPGRPGPATVTRATPNVPGPVALAVTASTVTRADAVTVTSRSARPPTAVAGKLTWAAGPRAAFRRRPNASRCPSRVPT